MVAMVLVRYAGNKFTRYKACPLTKKKERMVTGFVITTSRASYEMVQKTVTAGIGTLAAVSAPTSLAIDLANKAGLTLIGFLRKDRHVVYANDWRIEMGDQIANARRNAQTIG